LVVGLAVGKFLEVSERRIGGQQQDRFFVGAFVR
jgi:hypothetical protein